MTFGALFINCVYAGPSPGYSSRGGQKPEGGPHFKNTVLDVRSNQGVKREMGSQISNGGPGTTGPPLATAVCVWLRSAM